MDWDKASAAPVIHARQRAGVPALCGAEARTPWTTKRSWVTCERCRAVIAERLKGRRG